MLDSDVDLSWRPVLCFFWPMSLGFFSSFLKKASNMVIQGAILAMLMLSNANANAKQYLF